MPLEIIVPPPKPEPEPEPESPTEPISILDELFGERGTGAEVLCPRTSCCLYFHGQCYYRDPQNLGSYVCQSRPPRIKAKK